MFWRSRRRSTPPVQPTQPTAQAAQPAWTGPTRVLPLVQPARLVRPYVPGDPAGHVLAVQQPSRRHFEYRAAHIEHRGP